MSVLSDHRSVSLLPSDAQLGVIDSHGQRISNSDLATPPDDDLLRLHRGMVIGRRFDTQAGALVRQGELAVYPSSRGQDACQVGAALALQDRDWLFPTYRDSVALVTRGVDPVQVLTLLRGDWHSGYDPYERRVAPQCTPLATNALHAVGFAHAARYKGEDTVALVLIGDGATSEGDTHEALNFAAVWKCPVVFLVQNNGYAISVPLSKQTAAPSLAHKGIGYGMPSMLIDGNDAAGVFSAVTQAVRDARAGGGPTLIEAVTYRMDAHTNADDATRYRSIEEVRQWAARDPIERLERYLRGRGLLDDTQLTAVRDDAETFAMALRERLHGRPAADSGDLFRFVYDSPTAMLRDQQQQLARELSDAAEQAPGVGT